MTSDACASRTLLCGSAAEMSATRYLRAPRTEIVYARVKLDEMRTRVDPNEGLSKAKRNISAEGWLRSIKQSTQERPQHTGDHRLGCVPKTFDNIHAMRL